MVVNIHAVGLWYQSFEEISGKRTTGFEELCSSEISIPTYNFTMAHVVHF